ncbi:MAG: RNA polymerase sigma-D factor [Deltaproteobacteria bacterium ADurb.Bin207]|jgi:RNA polymerase sigma factor for flagellar operon FliA|nr:MAG: RNA polymerase sigma-D factor [Deltaproteobacteria bacterium ADurb.Bin207]
MDCQGGLCLTEIALITKRASVTHVDPPEVMERFHRELTLVDVVAKQLYREVSDIIDVRELASFGHEGLLMAARRYEPDRGIPFRRYAYYRVRGAILDGMRSCSALPRRAHEKVRALQAANVVASGFFDDSQDAAIRGLSPEDTDQRLSDHLAVLATAMALGFSGQESVLDGERVALSVDSPDSSLETQELMQLVHQELPNLTPQEELFVRRHFFLDENIDTIAASLGLSKSWGSRILARAITKLSRRMQSRL